MGITGDHIKVEAFDTSCSGQGRQGPQWDTPVRSRSSEHQGHAEPTKLGLSKEVALLANERRLELSLCRNKFRGHLKPASDESHCSPSRNFPHPNLQKQRFGALTSAGTDSRRVWCKLRQASKRSTRNSGATELQLVQCHAKDVRARVTCAGGEMQRRRATAQFLNLLRPEAGADTQGKAEAEGCLTGSQLTRAMTSGPRSSNFYGQDRHSPEAYSSHGKRDVRPTGRIPRSYKQAIAQCPSSTNKG